jgi:hypothetical protein
MPQVFSLNYNKITSLWPGSTVRIKYVRNGIVGEEMYKKMEFCTKWEHSRYLGIKVGDL